jgi:hypothetical protein
MAATASKVATARHAENLIYQIRGERVMPDGDLASLYGVATKVLNQAVARNRDRFPRDFMFQLSVDETKQLLRSQIVTSKPGSGGRRYRSFAFSEQGVAMLSSVLRSPRAVQVNIEIMRTFVRLRQWLASNVELTRRLNDLEKKYDDQFKAVFEAIRELMAETADEIPASRREIGFHTVRQTRNNKFKASR